MSFSLFGKEEKKKGNFFPLVLLPDIKPSVGFSLGWEEQNPFVPGQEDTGGSLAVCQLLTKFGQCKGLQQPCRLIGSGYGNRHQTSSFRDKQFISK